MFIKPEEVSGLLIKEFSHDKICISDKAIKSVISNSSEECSGISHVNDVCIEYVLDNTFNISVHINMHYGVDIVQCSDILMENIKFHLEEAFQIATNKIDIYIDDLDPMILIEEEI